MQNNIKQHNMYNMVICKTRVLEALFAIYRQPPPISALSVDLALNHETARRNVDVFISVFEREIRRMQLNCWYLPWMGDNTRFESIDSRTKEAEICASIERGGLFDAMHLSPFLAPFFTPPKWSGSDVSMVFSGYNLRFFLSVTASHYLPIASRA